MDCPVTPRGTMTIDRKKPGTDFVVRLVGSGIRPWAVPMRTLTKVLDAVQRLVEQKDEFAESEYLDEHLNNGKDQCSVVGKTLHLLDVKNRSAGYAVSVPDGENALRVISGVGKSIRSPEQADWTDPTLSSLSALSEAAKSLGCEIEFRKPGDGKTFGPVIAKITPSTYKHISTSAFIYGKTSVYARVERVGGSTARHCGIRLPEIPRKMVICRVSSDEIVRLLGKHLYEYLILSGDATWVKHNWRLKTLSIDSLEPPKTGSVMEALRLAHDSGGHAWDTIDDPDEAIAEIRRS